jgi:hypothetical protein
LTEVSQGTGRILVFLRDRSEPERFTDIAAALAWQAAGLPDGVEVAGLSYKGESDPIADPAFVQFTDEDSRGAIVEYEGEFTFTATGPEAIKLLAGALEWYNNPVVADTE